MKWFYYVLAGTFMAIFAGNFAPAAENKEFCGKGKSAAKSGKLREGISYYNRCIGEGQLEPRNLASAFYERANLRLATRNYAAAIRDYSQAIRLRPDYKMAYGSRGLAYEASGKKPSALADFKAARELGMKESWLLDKLKSYGQ